MKRGGAGNPLGEEKSFFEDMKQEDEKEGVEPVTLSEK